VLLLKLVCILVLVVVVDVAVRAILSPDRTP
jgi:hypothetical protein